MPDPIPDVGLPDLHPFVGMDMWRLLMLRAQSSATVEFLTWHPFDADIRTWTYADFARDAASVAVGLHRRGVRAGDRVMIHLENCPEFLLSWFACAALGAVAVTTNARSAADELRYYAEDSGAVGAITQPRFAEVVARAAPQLQWMVCTDGDATPGRAGGGAGAGGPGATSSFGSLRGDPGELIARTPDPAAVMSVQYTSGTTSRPKGVLWTHANALWAARVNAAHEHLRSDDCHLTYMPLFHANALAYSVLPTLWVGGRTVLLPKWSTSRFWEISLQHRCTWAAMMGLSARAVLSMEGPEAHSYRCFGAGVMDPLWEARLGVRTIGWWGMTETVSHGIVSDLGHPGHPGAIGRPAPEYGIRVVGADGRTPVAAEETGQLLIRGVTGLSMFAGYLNKAEATADSYDADGWFRTGDLVTPHPDGSISFADRSKDMLRVGAENVAASEIERVVMEVAGVQEVAVVSRPDGTLDEVPVAFVVGAASDGELAGRIVATCATKLADFKVPRQVEIVRALPRSTISKINKNALRLMLVSGTSLEDAEAAWLHAATTDPSGDAL